VNTLHLKYVTEVAKTGSITAAAEHLYMNQPNLSKAIKELENSLGIEIFHRTSKGIVPTKKGEEFLCYAQNILAQVEEMEALYKSDKMNKVTFRISVPRASYISYAYTKFIANMDHTKELDLNFKETNSMATITDVAEGECHLGIIRYQKNYENYFLDYLRSKRLTYENIWEYRYMALMPKDNPLAMVENLSYEDLEQYIEIIHGDLVVPHVSSLELKKKMNPSERRIHVYERGSQIDLLNQIPRCYMWVSPLPAEQLNRYGLVQKSCNDADQIFKDVLIFPKGYHFSKIDKAFLQEVREVKTQIASCL
jgi:DNA-binding transcriptional LysR family regulator